MTVSGASVKRASARIRDYEGKQEDYDILDSWRSQLAEFLPHLTGEAVGALGGIGFLSASRVKRRDAIERKIRRSQTTAETLDDVIGLRVICTDPESFESANNALSAHSFWRRTRDYSKVAKATGYRSKHHIWSIKPDGLPTVRFEIQVRTWRHHLWACLSESLGQQVKQGDADEVARELLDSFSAHLEAKPDLDRLQCHGAEGSFFWGIGVDRTAGAEPRYVNLGVEARQAFSNFTLLEEWASDGMHKRIAALVCAPNEELISRTHLGLLPHTLIRELTGEVRFSMPPSLNERIVA